MVGWIKLHRKITENRFWFSERFNKSQAWIDLLILATHTETIVTIENIDIKLQPGELCWSQRNLAKRWKWNESTVKRFLNRLQSMNMCRYHTNSLTTIITIVNWNRYQCMQELPQVLPQVNSQDKQEDKKYKKEKIIYFPKC